MNILEIILLPLLILAVACLPFLALIKNRNASRVKKAFILNMVSFFSILVLAAILPIGGLVNAAEATETAVQNSSAGWAYLSAALAVGFGCIGGGIAVGAGAPAAIGAVAEEPKSFGKAIIFVALGESVALYGLIIAFMILGKV